MLQHIIRSTKKSLIPITPIAEKDFKQWKAGQPAAIKAWVESIGFEAKPGKVCLIPGKDNQIKRVLLGLKDQADWWGFGDLTKTLPAGNYRIDEDLEATQAQKILLAWCLGAYQFDRYKKEQTIKSKLLVPESCNLAELESMVAAIYLVRDLINTPAQDMGPAELAEAVVNVGKEHQGNVTQIVGDQLLASNYPAVHAVGRASEKAPCFIDLQWNDEASLPEVVLVGKGVCFDTGGLNLKGAAGMFSMKKDMGGAAHVIGLAKLIMAANLPIKLRVLVSAVENAISGNAYHPGDVINTRKGLTVEIGNTDAEGRLVLADALAEAASTKPSLIIDMATLTGAGRVALGTDLPAFFTDQEDLATALTQAAEETDDPIWRLPLYAPYRELLNSKIADLSNTSSSVYGGAITAALFLKEFVPATIPWIHFDLMASNAKSLPGRPEGGEAMGIRAIFHYLQTQYTRP